MNDAKNLALISLLGVPSLDAASNKIFEEIRAKKYTLVYFGEIGNDPDEEGSLLFLAILQKLGFIDKIVVIANRLPVLERAQMARGTMDELGLPETVVAMGETYGLPQTNYDVQFDVPYKSDRIDFPNYTNVFWSTLKAADNGSVIVVAASGMTDLAELLKPDTKTAADNEVLFCDKVAMVGIMGGLVTSGSEENIATDGFDAVRPDWSAVNNSHDWMAAYILHKRLQELGVRTIVLGKSTAYGASVPRDVYDLLAATGHKVGIRLQNMQERLIQHLWKRANLPADDEVGREGLASPLGKAWFAKVFCGKNPEVLKLSGEDRIWDYIKNFQLYDQLTVLAAIPGLSEIHFQSTLADSCFESVGTTKIENTRTNLRDPQQTATAIINAMLGGLLSDSWT